MKITIWIPVYNNLKDLDFCLKSICENVWNSLFDLLIVDDNSTQNITEFLKKFINDENLWNIQEITYIKNAKNMWFPHNANIILDETKSQFICILNSDIYVCEGALEKMMKILQENEDILVAWPSTSQANSPQQLKEISKIRHTLTENQIKEIWIQIAEKFQNNEIEFLSQWETHSQIQGFCYMMKAKSKEIIGYFDEVFWLWNFEESDYNSRIEFLWYKSAWVKTAYVHHFWWKSFKTSLQKQIKYLILLGKNWLIWMNKRRHYTAKNITKVFKIERDNTKEILFRR